MGLRMIDKQKHLINSYWSRTELGREMLASDRVSDSDLLFLIPNNVKRRHGLPATRCPVKHHKRKYKEERRRFIFSFRLFELIEEIIDKTLPTKINDKFFGQFVEMKNVVLGDEAKWQLPQAQSNFLGNTASFASVHMSSYSMPKTLHL